MANKTKTKITKEELKQIIKRVLDESNYFHDSEGEFSSEKDATSLSRHDIGQYEYPSKKTAFPCGRLSPQRDWCKAGKQPKKKSVLEGDEENESDAFEDRLRMIIAQEIESALRDWLTDDLDPNTSPLPRGSG